MSKGVVTSCPPRLSDSEGREMLCGEEGETWMECEQEK